MAPITGGTSGIGAAFARQHSVKALACCTIPMGSKSAALPLRWVKQAQQRRR
jgi:short-subunit dehydrogenase involved in D-alanine esterification of teichoic acids